MWPCSAHPALLAKPELKWALTEETLKIHPWWKLFFSKNASPEFIPCDFIKNELHHRDYLAWVLQGTFFNILENFLGGITVISFIQEVITLLKGLGLVSRTRHLQLWMPMLMLLQMPRCRCRDFQMVFCQFIGDHLFCRAFKWLLLNLPGLDLLFYDFCRG